MDQAGHRASHEGASSRSQNRDPRSRSPRARRSDDRDGDYHRSRKGTIASFFQCLRLSVELEIANFGGLASPLQKIPSVPLET